MILIYLKRAVFEPESDFYFELIIHSDKCLCTIYPYKDIV